MSPLAEPENLEEAEFRWGKKKGVGGKNKDVRFYETFAYDGVDYALYDCVYMYKEGEPAPYIGKLVKIWENAEKRRRIKVQWFFRPSEISYYLGDTKVLDNELFFASGDGKGLTNLNPVEAIAGKCNVICISKDSRNPQPSAEDLGNADYVFYRIFDVASFIISDQMDDKVGGLEVKYVFNRREGVRTLDVPKLDSDDKDEEINVVAGKEKSKLAGKNITQQLTNVKLNKNSDHTLEEQDTDVTLAQVKQGSLPGKYSSGFNAISSKNRETTGTTIGETSMLGAENVAGNVSSGKDELKDMKSPGSQVQAEEGMKSARKSCNSDDAPSKRVKSDGKVSSLKVQDTSGVQSLTVPGNDAAHLVTVATSFNAKPKSELVKNSVRCGKDVKLAENSSFLDENMSRSGQAEDAVGLQKNSKLNKDLSASQGKLSKSNSFPSIEKSESAQAKDSIGIGKDKKLSGNLSACKERPSTTNVVSHDETPRPSTTNVVSHDETPRPSTTNVSPNEPAKSGSNKDFEGSGQVANFVKSSTTTKKSLKRSADLFKEKSYPGHEKSYENKDKTLASDSCPIEERSPKKAKFDDSIKRSGDNKNNAAKKVKEKNCIGETKNSPKVVTSYDNKPKSRLGEATMKEHHNVKDGKLSNDNLPNPLITRSKDDSGKVGGQIIEVTRRPTEKSKWIKLRWEDNMKSAHEHGKLVLLQNLDPEYTSGEVEDIIWHVFEEKCTARMVQHTAISNPHSGEAFVIFGSREAADRVVQKLDDGCLILPNQRPLVGCHGVLPKFSEKQTAFVGHLAIDKARRQIQREMKDAVSTSHYSQNNTIEYEMAMDWCLLQSKSDEWWEKLYQQQRKELKKLKDNLKQK